MTDWEAEINAREARLLELGLSPTRAANLAGLFVVAHTSFDKAVADALATQARCKQAASLCREIGSKAAGEAMGAPDRTVRWWRGQWLKSRQRSA